jgi:hypothetical protein
MDHKNLDLHESNIILDDSASIDQIAHLAKRYTLVEGDLYRYGVNDVIMWCITREEDSESIAEVHGGECGNHVSSRTLVDKAFWHRFYWPTALQDIIEMVKTCHACQFHAKQIHTSAQMLQMIPPSWPFAGLELDILGPFPRAVRGYWYLYVTSNKFTKWPKVTPVVKINKQSAVKFIVCRFGVPNRIVTDNGYQFTSSAF